MLMRRGEVVWPEQTFYVEVSCDCWFCSWRRVDLDSPMFLWTKIPQIVAIQFISINIVRSFAVLENMTALAFLNSSTLHTYFHLGVFLSWERTDLFT